MAWLWERLQVQEGLSGVLHTREGILYTARVTTEGPGGGIGNAALVLYATPLVPSTV